MTKRLGLILGRLPGFEKTVYDRRELLECVRAADASGYESFWCPEAWERDAFTVLTDVAAHTKRIGLGTGIVNVFSRSPALLAMSAATLDEISGGRFRLGLGTSGALVIEEFHGVPYQKSLTRLKETIQIVRLLLSGARADFQGECFRLSRFRLGFKPLRSEIPIYIAGFSEKTLRLIGEVADGWLPVYWPRERLSDGIEPIHAAARQAGRDETKIEVAPFMTVAVADDRERAREMARWPITYYIGGMGVYYHAMVSRMGFREEADRVRAAWEARDVKAAMSAVSDPMLDAIAVCGPIEYCREKFDEWFAAGATLLLVPIPRQGTTEEKCRIIERLIE
jgi:F420-dependent oxidoreductase-like protein